MTRAAGTPTPWAGMNQVIDRECGRTCFFYAGLPPGRPACLDPAKVMLLNGARPAFGDRVHCGSCGRPMGAADMDWIVRSSPGGEIAFDARGGAH